MTRLDWIHNATAEDLSEEICDMIGYYHEDLGDELNKHYKTVMLPHHCLPCPAYKMCRVGHRGLIDWLNEEVKE